MTGAFDDGELPALVAGLDPGARLVGWRELTGGVSATVLALELVTPDGRERRVVLRRPQGDFKQHDRRGVIAKEHDVLAAVRGKGLAVPEPYGYDEGTAGGAPYLLLEWIDGTTELAVADRPAGLDQMASFLAALHALDTADLSVPGLAPIEDPRAAARSYLPATATGRRATAALDACHVTPFDGRPSLLHGDYWPGNVLWRDGRLAAVIDWEDAALGDPLADLATARVELLCCYGTEAVDRFTDRYLAARRWHRPSCARRAPALGALRLGRGVELDGCVAPRAGRRSAPPPADVSLLRAGDRPSPLTR